MRKAIHVPNLILEDLKSRTYKNSEEIMGNSRKPRDMEKDRLLVVHYD